MSPTCALEGYLYLHSTRGELMRRSGRREEALAAYRRAAELAGNRAERELIERRIRELASRD